MVCLLQSHGHIKDLDTATYYQPHTDYREEQDLGVDRISMGRSQDNVHVYCFQFDKDTLFIYRIDCLQYDSIVHQMNLQFQHFQTKPGNKLLNPPRISRKTVRKLAPPFGITGAGHPGREGNPAFSGFAGFKEALLHLIFKHFSCIGINYEISAFPIYSLNFVTFQYEIIFPRRSSGNIKS